MAAVAPRSTLIWSDNFDSYTAGSNPPAPWVCNNGNTQVSTSQAHSGTKSLACGAGGNNGTAYRLLGANLSIILADFWMWTGTQGAASAINSAVQFANPAMTTLPYIGVDQTGNGAVGNPNGAWFTFSVTTAAWHHYVFTMTMAAAGNAALSIDGVSVGTYTGDTRAASGVAYTDRIFMSAPSIGPSPPGIFFVDDLSISDNTPPAPTLTGNAYPVAATRAGQSAIVWQTSTLTPTLAMPAVVGEVALNPAAPGGGARAMILA